MHPPAEATLKPFNPPQGSDANRLARRQARLDAAVESGPKKGQKKKSAHN